MGKPGGRADLRITNCVLISGGSQQETGVSLKLGNWRRLYNNKGTVHEDLGGRQGNLKGQFGALGDSGSSYHPRVCVGRATWQELGPSV